MTFKEWMKQFKNDGDDTVGKLAKLIDEDIHFPETKNWYEVFLEMNDLLPRGSHKQLDKEFAFFEHLWRAYKVQHGENIVYLEIQDAYNREIYSEFVQEKVGQWFIFNLLLYSNVKYNLISEPENFDEDGDLFLIQIDNLFKTTMYNNLNEILEELSMVRSLILFPQT